MGPEPKRVGISPFMLASHRWGERPSTVIDRRGNPVLFAFAQKLSQDDVKPSLLAGVEGKPT